MRTHPTADTLPDPPQDPPDVDEPEFDGTEMMPLHVSKYDHEHWDGIEESDDE